jgi:hypothetical protein
MLSLRTISPIITTANHLNALSFPKRQNERAIKCLKIGKKRGWKSEIKEKNKASPIKM